MNKTELKDQVVKYIGRVQLIEAIELLESFIAKSSVNYCELSKTITLNKTNLNFSIQQKHKSTITDEAYKLSQIKISQAILYIVEDIDDNDSVNGVENNDRVNGINTHLEDLSKSNVSKENINSIIVDDEINGIKTLHYMLLENCPNVNVVETFQSSKDALTFIKNQKPDLLFLDIHMPLINGLELLNNLGYKDYNAIFTTAYEEYMLSALRLNAIDFLMKPIDKVDLINAVERVKEELTGNINKDQISIALKQIKVGNHINQHTRFGIKINKIIRYVQLSDICYIKSKSNTTQFCLVDKSIVHSSEPLNTIEIRMPDKYFFRCHLEYMVNMFNVKEYDAMNQSIKMICSQNIYISKDRQIDFKNLIKDFS